MFHARLLHEINVTVQSPCSEESTLTRLALNISQLSVAVETERAFEDESFLTCRELREINEREAAFFR